jgi:hypothetical protein
MIIVKLQVADKEQGDAFAVHLLKNKFPLNVFGNLFDSYYLDSSQARGYTHVYVIQFLTKSMLFSEIEASLKKEFPQINFSICATPIVHMAINLHDKIRQRVNGTTLLDNETAS